ncbi:MAG: dienelactone hydrolase family protein [Verrucomicrobia bacterium]|nr:dienelactone hydrolase family protein [Cytophagales bacterium]
MKKIIFLLSFIVLSHSLLAQDFALKQLEKSPRHQEWVKVQSGNRQVNCFVVFPEKAKKTTAVIIIHENQGLTDWVRSFADQLAAEGYLAIAPDLLSDFDSTHHKTTDFASADAARTAIYQLKQEQVSLDLNQVQQYASKLEAANGKTASIGFCWGGGQSFRFATNPALKTAMVFYGSSLKKEEIEQVSVPVYGFYGENDQRINAGISDTEKQMKEKVKKYDYKIYPGATHAYMRQGDDPKASAENKKARDESWKRIKLILAGIR